MGARRQGSVTATADRVDVRRRAWRALMQTVGTVSDTLDRELRARTDLDLQTYDALLHVYEARDAGIRMSDLARNISLSKPGLTGLVDRLEKRGLIARTADPEDRRAIRVVLTDAGREAFLAAADVHVDGIAEHFTSRLTDEEAQVIADALERIRGEELQRD